MTYTNEEIRRIYIRLDRVKGLEGIRVLYSRDRTLRSMRDLYEATDPDKVIPISPAFKAYEEKLRDLYSKFATKDGTVKTRTEIVDGKPGEVFDFDPNDPLLKKEKAKLDKEHSEAIETRKKQESDYRDFLKEEVKEEVKIFRIPLALAPTDQVKFEAISPLIADMTPELQEEWETLFAKMVE